jgi:hypothetical protein
MPLGEILMDWQDIATAPRDVKNVLTHGPNGYAVAWSMGDGWWAGDCEENAYELEPTHWMPLPAPPSQEQH